MTEVTRILSAIQDGDPRASDQLLPLVYDELRQLATQRLAQEKPGQTLQATALVHEAYLRLVSSTPSTAGPEGDPAGLGWQSRGHFFAAAAEAMRRILIDSARRKRRAKHGGSRHRVDLEQACPVAEEPSDDLEALDEALGRLEATDPPAAQLVKLRYFAGLTMPQAAEALGLSLRTAQRNWTYARTWLRRELARNQTERPPASPPG
jgi:RNA polymerase sigma factor (TIGR02999 family)